MSSISWFRLPRGRVWHVALTFADVVVQRSVGRALCGAFLPVHGGEWQPLLPPNGARICSECTDVDERIGNAIAHAVRRADEPLPVGDEQVVDSEIVDAEFDTNDVAVIREARMISFGPYSNEGSSESAFPFAGISIVNGTVTGSIEVDDVDGRLAAQIAALDQGGTLEAGFDPDGDEIVIDPDGDPDRSVPETAVVDLVAALRGSVEAAKQRRAEAGRDQP